jgi:hypothetical protein
MIIKEVKFGGRGIVVKAYAAKRKGKGSVPDELIPCFNLPNPSGREPLSEMRTRSIKIMLLVLTTLTPSVSRLSKQCEILNVSQSYRPNNNNNDI